MKYQKLYLTESEKAYLGKTLRDNKFYNSGNEIIYPLDQIDKIRLFLKGYRYLYNIKNTALTIVEIIQEEHKRDYVDNILDKDEELLKNINSNANVNTNVDDNVDSDAYLSNEDRDDDYIDEKQEQMKKKYKEIKTKQYMKNIPLLERLDIDGYVNKNLERDDLKVSKIGTDSEEDYEEEFNDIKENEQNVNINGNENNSESEDKIDRRKEIHDKIDLYLQSISGIRNKLTILSIKYNNSSNYARHRILSKLIYTCEEYIIQIDDLLDTIYPLGRVTKSYNPSEISGYF